MIRLHAFKSLQESLLYFLILILIIGNVSLLISVQQQTKAIEQNQLTNSKAIKDYIDCLINIDPHGDIHSQENSCFNSAPQVK